VFSVMRDPCRVYISEPNSEARRGRSTEESREWEYNGVQLSTTERTRIRIESGVVDQNSGSRQSKKLDCAKKT
jgi:hypothetical protein